MVNIRNRDRILRPVTSEMVDELTKTSAFVRPDPQEIAAAAARGQSTDERLRGPTAADGGRVSVRTVLQYTLDAEAHRTRGDDPTRGQRAEGLPARKVPGASLGSTEQTMRGIALAGHVEGYAPAGDGNQRPRAQREAVTRSVEFDEQRTVALPSLRELSGAVVLPEASRVHAGRVHLGQEHPTCSATLAEMLGEHATAVSLGRAAATGHDSGPLFPPNPQFESMRESERPANERSLRVASPTLHLSPRDRVERQPKSQSRWRVPVLVMASLAASAFAVGSYYPEQVARLIADSGLAAQQASLLPGLPTGGGAAVPAAQAETARPSADHVPSEAMPPPAELERTVLTPQEVVANAEPPSADHRAVAPNLVAAEEVAAATTEVKGSHEHKAADTSDGARVPSKVAKVARPELAASLYLEGRFKDALNEYRTLATERPEQPAYAQFARILRRRIVDTCLLTQPHRAAECEQL